MRAFVPSLLASGKPGPRSDHGVIDGLPYFRTRSVRPSKRAVIAIAQHAAMARARPTDAGRMI